MQINITYCICMTVRLSDHIFYCPTKSVGPLHNTSMIMLHFLLPSFLGDLWSASQFYRFACSVQSYKGNLSHLIHCGCCLIFTLSMMLLILRLQHVSESHSFSQMNDSPLYEYATFLFTYWWTFKLFSPLGMIMNNVAINIHVQVSCYTSSFFI